MLQCTALKSVQPIIVGRRHQTQPSMFGGGSSGLIIGGGGSGASSTSDARRGFFWSEIVTFRVTLAFNPSAPLAYRAELHTQHGGPTVADAWCRAAKHICEAALISTTVTPAAPAAPAASSVLSRPPSSSSVMMGSRQRQAVEAEVTPVPAMANSSSGSSDASESSVPTVTFDVTFSLPYSSSAATAKPAAAAAANSHLCEMEILLFASSALLAGSSYSPLQHSDVFALLRHTVPIGSALLIASRAVGCVACNHHHFGGVHHHHHHHHHQHGHLDPAASLNATLSGSMATPSKSSLLMMQQQVSPSSPASLSGTMALLHNTAASAQMHADYHRVIVVQCRNSCENHVRIDHVEMESSLWVAARSLQQQTSKVAAQQQQQQQQQQAVLASNPWVVRHRNDVDSVAALAGIGPAPQPPQLVVLGDPFPITLKPSEVYTFCFEYFSPPPPPPSSIPAPSEDDAETLQLLVRTTVASRPVLVNHTLRL